MEGIVPGQADPGPGLSLVVVDYHFGRYLIVGRDNGELVILTHDLFVATLIQQLELILVLIQELIDGLSAGGRYLGQQFNRR